jgi:hypothetical protein
MQILKFQADGIDSHLTACNYLPSYKPHFGRRVWSERIAEVPMQKLDMKVLTAEVYRLSPMHGNILW